MKTAYLGFNNLRLKCGVSRKTLRQVTEWNRLGAETQLFALMRSADQPELNCGRISIQTFRFDNARMRSAALAAAFKAIAKWEPDLIYMRMGPFYPHYFSGFRVAPTVIEINTDDSVEYRQTKSTLAAWYHRLTRGFMFSRTAGGIYLTDELRARMAPAGKPAVTISNGIERTFPRIAPNNPQPRLFFIGTAGYSWHGVDKIVRLARIFTQWTFDIVGYAESDFPEKAPFNVKLWGRLDEQEFAKVAQQCDVAIGTLALHRKKMFEACPLKVREYLGLGLPTIIGYKDTDDLEALPFVLCIPNQEDSIDISRNQIEAFVSKWMGRLIDNSLIEPLKVERKEENRLHFFQRIISS